MAKKKKEESEDNMFSDLAELTSGNILGELDNCRDFIDTGTLAVNYICSGKFIKGGVPNNRITEIYGPSSSGKSLVAANILFGCQKNNGIAIYLDCENATNAEWMESASHIDTKKVLRYTPFTLEEAFLKIHNSVKKIREYEVKNKLNRRPIVIVYDSISVSPCEREFRETDLPEEYNPAMWKKIVGAKEQPGERAKVCSKELRKVQPLLEKEDVTLVIINQIRSKIGVLYGNPETTAGGGNSLEFYASCRIRTQQRKKIEHTKLKSYDGINMSVKNIKNRAFRPFVTTEGIKLYFKTGINPVSGLLSLLAEGERIISVSPGNWKVADSFLPEGREEYKFKAAKENNDIPLTVLLECPLLVDSTKEELDTYLTPFQSAIEYTNSGLFSEKSVGFDADGNFIESDVEEDEAEE